MPEGLTDAQVIERLERNARTLAESVGVALEDPSDGVDPDVVAIAQSGDRRRPPSSTRSAPAPTSSRRSGSSTRSDRPAVGSTRATVVQVARDVSIHELRDRTAAVIAEVEAGERLTSTVNRRRVADIVPHAQGRDPWVPATELRRILRDAPADRGLLADVAAGRRAELGD
jgi:antitoxin (DNA-binding transcriptional repressor) of toxin-antitoxin stability system